MRNFNTVTLSFLVATQPWQVPYSTALNQAVDQDRGLGHLMGSHITLHAAKTVGQIAAVFEQLDHTGAPIDSHHPGWQVLRDKAADLVTAAMRLANLYGFDLARAVVERSEEKNGVTLPAWPTWVHVEGQDDGF